MVSVTREPLETAFERAWGAFCGIHLPLLEMVTLRRKKVTLSIRPMISDAEERAEARSGRAEGGSFGWGPPRANCEDVPSGGGVGEACRLIEMRRGYVVDKCVFLWSTSRERECSVGRFQAGASSALWEVSQGAP